MEDTVEVAETTAPAATEEDSSYSSVLSSERATEEVSTDGVEAGKQVEEKQVADDPEFTLREGLKAKLSEIEKWRAGHMMQEDYTKKTQALAQERKSLESAFGGKVPDLQSIQNLGKLYQAYFKDQRAAQVIDSILAGQLDKVLQGQTQGKQEGSQDSYVQGLESKISELEQKLDKFTGSIEQREQMRVQGEAKQTWDSWVAKRQETDKSFVVTEDIDSDMGALIPGIAQRHPDWDDNKVLDYAYRLATIDQQPKKIAQNILKDADEAKKGNPPKITSKSGGKPVHDQSYSELVTG